MESLWNPRRVLGVDPNGSFTCVGKTKKGVRCRQSFFSNSDLRMASNLLDQMAVINPRDTRTYLRPLAEATLCPRWHRKPGYSQVESMRQQWWVVIVSYAERLSISSPISNPVRLPRHRARAPRSTETASTSRRLLTPDSSPPSHVIAPSLPQENFRLRLTSTGFISANPGLATPPVSPPSPELAPRSLLGSVEQVVDSHESNLATLSLLTPPTSPPTPTPAPRIPQRSNLQALTSTVSTVSTFSSLSYSMPSTSPPSPTPAPRHLRRSIRRSTVSDQQVSESPSLPELPSSPLPVTTSLPEVPQTLDSIESPSASLILSTAPTLSTPPMERPLSSPPADIERPISLVESAAVTPPQAPLVSRALSRASSNRSVPSEARSIAIVVPTTTSPQLPEQTPPVDDNDNNSTSIPLLKATPTVTILSLQTPPSTPRVPRRLPFSSTWQQIVLESPVQQPSPSPYSYSKQLIPLSCQEETKSVDGDCVSCLAKCSGHNILSGCSALWQKVSLGTRKFTAEYICCSSWQYELH